MTLNGTQNSTLSTWQRRAIEQLVALGNVSEAAKEAGVGRSTLYRWLREDDFKLALGQAEAEALAELRRELLSMRSQATKTILEIMEDPDSPVWARLRAADIAIRRLLQIGEMVTVEQRLTRLEGLVNAQKRNK